MSPEDGYFIYVQGKPKTKARPRITKNGTFTPKTTLDYEQCVRDTWEQSGHPTLDGPLGVRIIYTKDGAAIWVYQLDDAPEKIWVADIDNLIKCTLDGLQQKGDSGAFVNDASVRQVDAIKL